ncbi:LytR C-terminal domain-containing protein [Corynebacterium humireducens]|nr:LytR C-terminal domain-containing protein [Corynebacterium humireducens]
MTNVNPENQSSSGLPLRGLAMVLIAVAVLLAMWGLYASTQNSSDTTDGAGSATSADTTAVATAPGRSASPEADRDTAAADAADDAADAEAREEGDVEKQQPPAPRPAPAPEPERLNVLNNSTVPNLAAQVADRLREDGFEVGEVGNLADHILPETTVFFQPGNAAAEQRARELADRLGGVAREYEGFLPENTAGRNDLTLVLVNQVAL